MKNDYYNIHRKFQVHNTNIFRLEAKTNIMREQPPSTLTAYPTQYRVVYFFELKCPGRMIPQLECSHLMVELSILAGWKKSIMNSNHYTFNRQWLSLAATDLEKRYRLAKAIHPFYAIKHST